MRPQQNPWHLFTVSPLPAAEQGVSHAPTGRAQLAVGVGPIHLPGYLDQNQIVSRISENRFALSDNDRWAEPLAHNIENVLVENLSMLIPSDAVTVHPWPGQQRSHYQLEIEVLHFETDTTGTAHFAARYLLRDVATGKTIATKDARLTATTADRSTEQSVATLSKLLSDFSLSAANVIREHLNSPKSSSNETLHR